MMECFMNTETTHSIPFNVLYLRHHTDLFYKSNICQYIIILVNNYYLSSNLAEYPLKEPT